MQIGFVAGSTPDKKDWFVLVDVQLEAGAAGFRFAIPYDMVYATAEHFEKGLKEARHDIQKQRDGLAIPTQGLIVPGQN